MIAIVCPGPRDLLRPLVGGGWGGRSTTTPPPTIIFNNPTHIFRNPTGPLLVLCNVKGYSDPTKVDGILKHENWIMLCFYLQKN
jgi:hypothetical protein